jgi:hypothetical protein
MRHTPHPPVDLAEVIPDFAPLARTTVRLHPRRGAGALAQSKMGGMFLGPQEEPWPVCAEHGSPYVTVLQLRAEDVPELAFPQDTDLFQLLWCPNDHEESRIAPLPTVYWRTEAAITEPLVLPPPPKLLEDFSVGYSPTPCCLHPEQVIEYPDVMELDDYPGLEQQLSVSPIIQYAAVTYANMEEPIYFYQTWLSVADGTKVGGYPGWLQFPQWPICACGERMEHLLTITSVEFYINSLGRWLPVEDEEAWQNDPDAVQRAADLYIARNGNLYVFICRRCPNWPISSLAQ